PLGQIAFYVVMNEARYNGLSPEHRAILNTNTRRLLSLSAENGWNATADRILADLRANPSKTVIDLTEEEIAAFTQITDEFRAAEIARIDAEEVVEVMVRSNVPGESDE